MVSFSSVDIVMREMMVANEVFIKLGSGKLLTDSELKAQSVERLRLS